MKEGKKTQETKAWRGSVRLGGAKVWGTERKLGLKSIASLRWPRIIV